MTAHVRTVEREPIEGHDQARAANAAQLARFLDYLGLSTEDLLDLLTEDVTR